jgi:hypothetical protein
LYVKDGALAYEYNLFEIQRSHIKATGELPTGKARIEVETTYVERKPAGPLKVVLKVNGKEVASGEVLVSAPVGFTANDALDFGIDLGSPVGIEYYDLAPFKFNGKIAGAQVKYLGSAAEVKKSSPLRGGHACEKICRQGSLARENQQMRTSMPPSMRCRRSTAPSRGIFLRGWASMSLNRRPWAISTWDGARRASRCRQEAGWRVTRGVR